MIAGDLARRAERLSADRVPFVLATVVRARHPTGVRPGDSAIVLADGTIEGFVGGMCAASSVRLYAMRALETGESVLLRLVPDDVTEADELEGAVVEHNPCLSGGALEIFLEPALPALRVTVVGSSPIAVAVAALARAAGYDAVRESAEDVNPGAGDAALVVASHGSGEERALSGALLAGVPYVALVASRARGAAVRDALDVPEDLRAQLHTPAGLDIGARTPAEIAIAILAELVEEHHAAPGPAPAGGREPVSATDPVCGMEVALTEATISLERPGDRVYFCSEHCRAAYVGDVAKR